MLPVIVVQMESEIDVGICCSFRIFEQHCMFCFSVQLSLAHMRARLFEALPLNVLVSKTRNLWESLGSSSLPMQFLSLSCYLGVCASKRVAFDQL